MSSTKSYPTDQAERLLLRADEVAVLLGVGRATAYELMAGGELPVVRIGRSIRVPLTGLRAWIDSRTTSRQ